MDSTQGGVEMTRGAGTAQTEHPGGATGEYSVTNFSVSDADFLAGCHVPMSIERAISFRIDRKEQP